MAFMNLMRKLDGALDRLVLRFCAVIAFLCAAAAAVFGGIVLVNGHAIGVLILLTGVLFLWLGRLAWKDKATLSGVLNRDFEPAKKGKPKTDTRGAL